MAWQSCWKELLENEDAYACLPAKYAHVLVSSFIHFFDKEQSKWEVWEEMVLDKLQKL